ncbi:DNA-directed RNA polymerase, omega subunit [Clostridioides difficile DA00165]|nr:DNA-directed RNA polymerase, omega subunit [Clostridioides difficile DA00165]
MLKPSINEVLEKIDNRYYLVGTVSKRARKLIDGEEPYVSNKTKEKPVCVATKEVASGITYRLLTEEEIEIEEARHHAEQHQQISEEE